MDEAAGHPLDPENLLARQLQYLGGWPEAQRDARQAFDTKQRRRLIAEAAGQEPVTLATYALKLAELSDHSPIAEMWAAYRGRLLAAMLDHALIAQDALVMLAQWEDELSQIAILPPVEELSDVSELIAQIVRLADNLQQIADLYGHHMAARPPGDAGKE